MTQMSPSWSGSLFCSLISTQSVSFVCLVLPCSNAQRNHIYILIQSFTVARASTNEWKKKEFESDPVFHFSPSFDTDIAYKINVVLKMFGSPQKLIDGTLPIIHQSLS